MYNICNVGIQWIRSADKNINTSWGDLEYLCRLKNYELNTDKILLICIIR